jgi:Metallopeptidase family M24
MQLPMILISPTTNFALRFRQKFDCTLISGVYLDQYGLIADIPLTAGMCVTVEPGLYFDPIDESIPEGYRGIGVRIEDDVVVKESGGVLVLSELL